MIKIDKSDELYKYLTNLGVKEVDNIYLELAENGRYKRKDVQAYFISKFQPSLTSDIDEKELEPILDYYNDLKQLKQPTKTEIKEALIKYHTIKDKQSFEIVQTAYLKDVLYMCINYKSLHKDADLQDLVQTANLGLITAINKYNPQFKIDIKDYIIFYIREMIIKEFEEKN